MQLTIITFILLGHWLADFVLQVNKQKPSRDKKLINKIKKLLKHLLPHTLVYSLILTFIVILLQVYGVFGSCLFYLPLLFFMITYITHFITDFTVTLINSNYLTKNKRHKYFVSIGLDQFIHYFLLFLTIQLIYF